MNNCPMTVIVDGNRLNRLGGGEKNEVGAVSWATGIDDLVSPGSIAGIELYTSAGRVPPEYQRLIGNCGVILIWTK